jgi:hypothetical protein
MNRSFRCVAMTLVALALITVVGFGQVRIVLGADNPKPGAPGAGLGGGIAYPQMSPLAMIPGYYQLSQENVQKEIELVPDQVEKLKQVGEEVLKLQKSMDWSKMQSMSQEERTKAMTDYRDQYVKQQQMAKSKVEGILLPHQIAKLKDIDFRSRLAWMFYNPQMVEKLNLTEGQKADLQKIRTESQEQMQKVQQEMQKQMQKMQQETADKTLKVLTTEQIESLKAQLSAQPTR